MLTTIKHLIPSKIPTTKEEFDHFCKDIFKAYGYPDKPGYRQMIASMIMHFDTTTTKASKRMLAKAIRKAQCNELAYWVIQETNKEMKEVEAAAAENQAKEAATGTGVTPDQPQTVTVN